MIRMTGKELVVTAPAGTAGESVGVLVVFEPGGEFRLPAAFEYISDGAGF